MSNKRNTIVMCIIFLLIAFSVGSVYISQLIFPEIAKTFGIKSIDARFAFSTASMVYAIAFFIFGPLTDILKTKTLCITGGLGVVLGLVGCILSPSFEYFLISMAVTGLFAASIPASLFAYISRTSTKENLASKIGIAISASVVGLIASRSIVSIITGYYNWKYSFIAYAIITLLLALSSRLLPNEDNIVKAKTSYISMYLNAIKYFFNIKTSLIFFTGFFLYFAYLGISSFLTYVLKEDPFNLSASSIGCLNIAGLISIVGSSISTKLNKYINKERLIYLCFIGILISIFIIGKSHMISLVLFGLIFLLLMVFASQPLIMSILSERVIINHKGSVSSLYLLSCLAGGSVGTSLLGNIWKVFNWSGVVYTCLLSIIIALVLAVFTFNYKGNSK